MRVRGVIAWLSALGLLAALWVAPAAGAATYTVSVCRTPAGTGVSLHGWTSSNGYGTPVDGCRAGGYFGADPPARTNGARRGGYTGWTLNAPPGTSIAGFDAWKTGRACCGGGPSSYSWMTGLFLDAVGRSPAHAPWSCFSLDGGCLHGVPDRERGYPTRPLDPRNHLAVRGLHARRLLALDGCWAGGAADCPGSASPVTQLHVYRLDLLLDDPTPPRFTSAPVGGLVDSAHPVAGAQSVLFRAADSGGGVAMVSVIADGHTVAAQPVGGCVAPYTRPAPCPASATTGIGLDTNRLRDGAHLISVVVSDPTGVNRAVFGPVRVVTRNQVPACETGAGAGARLSAGWGRRRRRGAHIRFGGRELLHGRVLDALGRPVAGRTVFLLGRSLRAGAPAGTLDSAVTDAGGRVHFTVHGLRSRRLRLAYRAAVTDTTAGCSGRVVASVRAPVTVAVSRRHAGRFGSVAFHGHVRGTPRPRRHHLLLALQAFTGRRWQTVKTFRARRSGAYRTAYRFKGGVGRFAFRVASPRDPTFPFAPGASRSVHVRTR